VKLNSYPSIYNLGHAAVADLLSVPVYVEEKVDGSQFSFGVTEDGLSVRSKGAWMPVDAPEKMFSRAVDTAKELAPLLRVGWTYRGEYLQKPKHNTLAYNRVPNRHIILFDVNPGLEQYLSYGEKVAEADRIGLEIVPLVFSGLVSDISFFRSLLDRESILGGQKVEGLVVKPIGYSMYGPDKKVLMGKFVSEAFKESHLAEWKKSNPGSADIVQQIADQYRTPARWQKAVIHLKEQGAIEDAPRDIGKLLKETATDLHKECADEIKERLFKWAWPQIQRRVTNGLPEWYKDELLKRQFGQDAQ
jgi:hypothetical protein